MELLEPAPGEPLAAAVHRLRRRVECSSVAALPPLASEAEQLADRVCWTALDHGDASEFVRESTVAALFHEFAVSAHLLP
jgi:hypothetical protein